MEQQCINIIIQMAGTDKTTPIPVCSKRHIVSGGCEKQRIAIDDAVRGRAPLYDSNVDNMHIGHSRFKCPKPQSCSDTDCGWNKANLTLSQHDIDPCRGPTDIICPPCDDAVTLDGGVIAECHLMHGSTKKSIGNFGEWETKVKDTVPKPECKCHLIGRCSFDKESCIESHHAAEDEQTRALRAASNLCKAVVTEVMHHVRALHHQKIYTTYTVDAKHLAAAYTRSPGEIRWCVISNVSPQAVDGQHQLFAPRSLTKAQPTQAFKVYHEHKLWPDEELAVYYADRDNKTPTVCHIEAIDN